MSLEEDTPERDTEELTDVKSHHRELSTLMDCYRLTGDQMKWCTT